MSLPMESKEKRPPKAVIVGGSIAGISCVHSLIAAGWEVTVIEKSVAPPDGSPTGAGLSLEPQAREFISQWLSDTDLLQQVTLPLTAELHHLVDKDTKQRRALIRDDNFIYRCTHWTDLHSVLHRALPPGIILWGHRFQSLRVSDDKKTVSVQVLILETNKTMEIAGDILIAADGCLSSIRSHFLPEHKLRYSGYCAWRGVFDYSGNEKSDTMLDMRNAYPELGTCLYFDMSENGHCVTFQLRHSRINWIWYFNRPEPDLRGTSVTIKVDSEMIGKMHEEANMVWNPELAKMMRNTIDPFINVIYDIEPLQQLFWDNVVLIGDAAHATTPHGSRSTNMSILDAAVLGQCLHKWGSHNLVSALQEFQAIRLPVVSRQVLHSRYMGRLKQALPLDDGKVFDPKTASIEECKELLHRKLPFFQHVPISL